TVTSVETLPVTCTLTAVNGMRVNTVSSIGTVTIPLDGLPKGVYILNINQNSTDCGSMKIIR
ncbi:MAG: T9SS type A sorting domain-containing protein, partial [Muribaculaceae bacterium]|nr:T9SS type A sorting domain-containing protein [Muribaculaceae bacterium]